MFEPRGSEPGGRPDITLMFITAVLVAIGLVAVYSSSFVIGLADYGDANYFIKRQAIWAIGGALLFMAALNFDYRVYQRFAVPLAMVTIVALLAVLVIGVNVNGATRWIQFGGITVQPSEFAKLAIIIYLGAWLAGKGQSLKGFETGLVPFVIIISAVSVLLLMQPDFDTTFVIVACTVTMFWAAGATILQMTALGSVGIVTMSFLAVSEGYRLDRVQAFFNAEADPTGNGFQTLQALIALGNGGPGGLGLGASRGKWFYIPGSHTDGIFAIIGEELGIIATMSVLLLFLLLMVRGYQIANRAPDSFGYLVAVGITTWFVVQALVNIGGIIRVIPLAGIPLPFISSGGSALASSLLAMGVLVNISRYSRQPRKKMAAAAVQRRIHLPFLRRHTA